MTNETSNNTSRTTENVSAEMLLKQIEEAKQSPEKADLLIRSYIPFIRSEASKAMARFCTEQDDEYSIALMAFHEAILGYNAERGSFKAYASLIIRSRILDNQRKERKHQNSSSLDAEAFGDSESTGSVLDHIADPNDYYEDSAHLEATRQEILELSKILNSFGLSFSDVADNSPKQDRTLASCTNVINYAIAHEEILDELLQTKRLPVAKLVEGARIERKTLERHRKYIVAMLLIQTNGYEIIRSHLRPILRRRRGSAV